MADRAARVLIILDDGGRKHLVQVEDGIIRVPGVGALDGAKLVARIGRRIEIGGKRFLVLEPSARDLRESMKRVAQTLAPKDLAVIVFEADLRPGSRVVEAGAGSGALTVVLARAVGPAGRVFSYDIREEFLAVARANVHAAALDKIVELKIGDVRKAIAEREVDAVVFDFVDPWNAVGSAWDALRPSGHFASFSPNMEQVKETTSALRERPFVEIRTVEIIEREMEVREVGVRPSFAPLGHTGYLTFARKVLEPFP